MRPSPARISILLVLAGAACSGGTINRDTDAAVGSADSAGAAKEGGLPASDVVPPSAPADAAPAALDPWAGCPAAPPAGATGAGHVLKVTDTAVYCATFRSGGAAVVPADGFRRKAMLRLAPGTFQLPQAGRGEVVLPVCVRLGENEAALAPASSAWQVTRTGDSYSFAFTGPLDGGAGGSLRLVMDAAAPPGQPVALELDGSEVTLWGRPNYGFSWCAPGVGCPDTRSFDSCTHSKSRRRDVHEITFVGGQISLEVRISDGPSTTPAAFVRGSGTFRGRPFDQRSYWRLGYSPAQHHFYRGFGVLFDAPVDGICGIAIDRVADYGEVMQAAARTVDCAFKPLDRLELLDGRVVR